MIEPTAGIASAPADRTALLRHKAEELEAVFLAEMLAQARVGDPPEGAAFSGGPGEGQFASFLRQAQAQAIVAQGGLGLAESLFQALIRAETHDS